MKNRRTWLTAWAGVIVACAGQSEASLKTASHSVNSGVEFTVDLWPGEGIPVIEARREMLLLREEPDPDSPVVDTVRVPIGRRLVFDATRFQTITPGAIRSLAPMHVTGRDMGSTAHVSHEQYYFPTPDVSVPLAAATTIDFLQYRAEGTCFVRIERRVIDAHPCPGFGPESVVVERQPLTRWWIRVQGQSGAAGWILVSDSTAQSVRREF